MPTPFVIAISALLFYAGVVLLWQAFVEKWTER